MPFENVRSKKIQTSEALDESSSGSEDETTPDTFQEFNLCRPLLKAINELNWATPTKIQLKAIPVALKATDITACAVTGSGKTAAFMIPIIERLSYKSATAQNLSRALIIAPTRELAVQIHQTTTLLTKYLPKITQCLLAGGLDLKSQEASLRNNPDICIATPGRLIDHLYNTPSWSLDAIEILVLDEADRILEENFQEQLDVISKQCSRERQTMMFSATMTNKVRDLERVCLTNPEKIFVNENTDVADNLHMQFVRIRAEEQNIREATVAALVERSFSMHTLVFTKTKHHAHRLNILLSLFDIRSGELHGDMKQKDRLLTLSKFKNSDIDVLVCTDLASRGLDIPAVRHVINYTLPSSHKTYVHRVGRTARAGKSGTAISLVGERDRVLFEKIIKMNKKNPNAKKLENRSIPKEIIDEYLKSINSMASDVDSILEQEQVEKTLNIAESTLDHAETKLKQKSKTATLKRKWMESDTPAKKPQWTSKVVKNREPKGSFGVELADTSRRVVKKLKHDAGIKRKLHAGDKRKHRDAGNKRKPGNLTRKPKPRKK